jgi:hypothetical protein
VGQVKGPQVHVVRLAGSSGTAGSSEYDSFSVTPSGLLIVPLNSAARCSLFGQLSHSQRQGPKQLLTWQLRDG